MVPKWLLTKVLLLVIVFPEDNDGALQIDVIRNDFFELEDELWEYVTDIRLAEGDKDPGTLLIQKFQKFDKKVQQMPQDPEYGQNVSRRAYDFMLLYADFVKIHDLYEKFLIYQKKYLSDDGTRALTTDIVDDILNDPNNSVNSTTNRISGRILSSDRNGMMAQLGEITANAEYMCKNYAQAPQQVYHHLYNAIALSDLKGYILTQFAFMITAIQEEVNYARLALEARQEFKERTQKYIVFFRERMQISNSHNKLWRCDPETHKEGETYEQLTRLLQLHIENEADINEDRSCKKTCRDYTISQVHGCYDSESGYCHKRKFCSGRLFDCQEASHLNVCISDSTSSRRYDYMRSEKWNIWGHKTECSEVETPSWIRWFDYCSSCICICDEPGRLSDRFFNLRQVLSNVTDNRVVTGVRLVKHNRIIHMQIQEGKLLQYGYIDPSTIRWVPVDDYRITDSHVRKGLDYHTMSFEERDLYLDDLHSYQKDHIITGVGFTYKDGQIKLQVNVRKFNYENGTLDSDNHYITGGSDSRRRLLLFDPDIPILVPSNDQNFDTDRKVQFTHTSLTQDAGQTTVPFIDVQPVVTSPASPLKGVGIHWRGRIGSGGYVAPVITAYDFEQKMGVRLPDSPISIRDEKKFREVIFL